MLSSDFFINLMTIVFPGSVFWGLMAECAIGPVKELTVADCYVVVEATRHESEKLKRNASATSCGAAMSSATFAGIGEKNTFATRL